MANWSTLKSAIASVIKTNGNQEITGQVLQNTLNNIVNAIGENATFAGIATPTTNPGVPDGPVFYLATENGIYPNFGNIKIQKKADLNIISNRNSTWHFACITLPKPMSRVLNKGIYFEIEKSTKRIIKQIPVDSLDTINTSSLIRIPQAPFTCYNVVSTKSGPAFKRIPCVMLFNDNMELVETIFNDTDKDSIFIEATQIPLSAKFLVLQSSTANSIAYADFAENNDLIFDTGISLIEVLLVTEVANSVTEVANSVTEVANSVTEVANSVTEVANSVTGVANSVTEVANSVNMPKIENVTSKANPSAWLSSRYIKLGAKVLKVHFYKSSEDAQGKKAHIIVGQLLDDDTVLITSKTEIDINGESIDVSNLNIQVPIMGVVGLELDTNTTIYYTAIKPTDFNYPIFISSLQNSPGVGKKIYREKALNYLNFPFNIEIEENISKLDNINNKITNLEAINRSFSDKSCVILGDSITNLGNDDLSGPKGWTHYFKMWFDFKSIKSYARSGATWSCISDTKYNIIENTGSLSADNVGYNQVNRLLHDISDSVQEKPDYIIVALGTNDAWYRYDASSDGGIDAVKSLYDNTNYETDVAINTCTTVAKAIRYFSDMIINNLPDTQVIFLTPLQSSSISYEKIIGIGDIIEECAKYCSYPVIRQDKECGLYRIQEHRKYVNTYDGTHTSEIGAKKIGNYLAQRIKSLLR